MFNNKVLVTTGIELEISKGIEKAVEAGQIEVFKSLLGFIRSVLQLAIQNDSLQHFMEYIFFLPYIYNISYQKTKQNISLNYLHKYATHHAALHLKEIIWFDLSFSERQAKDRDKRVKFNQFYYWAFNSFNRFFYYLVSNKDYVEFDNTLNEYENITANSSNRYQQLKSEKWRLEINNKDGVNDAEIKLIKEEIAVEKKFEDYRSHTLLSIKYWIFFLFTVNGLSKKDTIKFSNRVFVYTEGMNLLQDILFVRSNEGFRYFEWQNWDYKERPSGKSYTPPNPHNWMTFGFLVDNLRENKLFINPDELDTNEIQNVQFLYEDLKANATYIKSKFIDWKEILNIKTEEELDAKIRAILSLFASVKRKSIGGKEKEIAAAPLSAEKIQAFKAKIGNTWKAQAKVYQLFRDLGHAIHLNDDNIKLPRIGQRTFFEKAKMMFIEGEHSDVIYGIERMGGDIGRWADEAFISKVFREDHNSVKGENTVTVIDKGLKDLSLKGVTPNLILSPPLFSHKDQDLFSSKSFVPKYLDNEVRAFPDYYYGTFDGIPVFISYSEMLKNQIFICDFNQSFSMTYKTNDQWFENILTVEVHEVTDDVAARKFKENPDKWRVTEDEIRLTEDEALTLIKTSVIIDIWATLDFQIKDKESFVVGYVVNDRSDN